MIKEVVQFSQGRDVEGLKFNQELCETIDLGAEGVLSALATDPSVHGRVTMAGNYPKDPLAERIVRAVGLPQNLGLQVEPLPEFFIFGLRSGTKRKPDPYRSSAKEIRSSELTHYVDTCLRRYGSSLPRGQKRYLLDMVGETIGNAEEHSVRGEWWVSAYLHQEPDDTVGDCHLTIFNFGPTLADTLRRLPVTSLLRKSIEKRVIDHRGRSFFRAKRWEADDLWTLYAIQGGVSRKNDGRDEVGDHGQGTADLIEFFQKLGRAQGRKPNMCVLSGSTHLLFDGQYQMERKETEEGQWRIIAFNDSNDLGKPPSEKHVRHLSRSFPGTLISMRFYLDPEHLNDIRKEEHHHQSG